MTPEMEMDGEQPCAHDLCSHGHSMRPSPTNAHIHRSSDDVPARLPAHRRNCEEHECQWSQANRLSHLDGKKMNGRGISPARAVARPGAPRQRQWRPWPIIHSSLHDQPKDWERRGNRGEGVGAGNRRKMDRGGRIEHRGGAR